MVRTQIQLTERQAEVLKQVAFERHTSMAAVIREAVDAIVERADNMVKRERDDCRDRPVLVWLAGRGY